MNSSVNKVKISIIVSDLSTQNEALDSHTFRPFLLAKSLQEIGYQVEIIGLAFNSNAPTIYHPEIKVISVPVSYYSGFVSAAKELIAKINGDVIYAINLKTTSFGLAILKKLLSNKPLILDIDRWELGEYEGDKFTYQPTLKNLKQDLLQKDGTLRYPDHPLYLSWLEKLLSWTDFITVGNMFLEQRFSGFYLPTCQDISLFNPLNYDRETLKSKYNLTDDCHLLFANEVNESSGIESILTALTNLNQFPLKLIIFNSQIQPDYFNYLQENWGQFLIKIKAESKEELAEISAISEVIIVNNKPSLLIEIMALSKPILVSNVTELTEIIGDTGFIFEPEKPPEIAQILQEILTNFAQANLRGLAARERCVNYYSNEAMANILAQIIKQLLS